VVAAETLQLFADLSPVDKQHLPLFSSFSRAALLAAHEVAPHIPRALLVREAGPTGNCICRKWVPAPCISVMIA
jgi:glycerophosphoryl diester phosphodiesterase